MKTKSRYQRQRYEANGRMRRKTWGQAVFLLYPLHLHEEPETIEVRYDINIDDRNEVKIPLEIMKVPFAFGENPEDTKHLLTSILSKVIQ